MILNLLTVLDDFNYFTEHAEATVYHAVFFNKAAKPLITLT